MPIVYVHINISSLLWFEFQPIRFFFFTCCHPPSLLPTPQTLVPDSATSAMSTPCSCAMKPRTENIAKPDTKLVPLLRPPSSRQSLCHTWRSLVDTHPLQFTHTPSAATTTVSPPPPPPAPEAQLTCSSCICNCCSSPVMSWRPDRWRRRRRSEFLHRSTPEGKTEGRFTARKRSRPRPPC